MPPRFKHYSAAERKAVLRRYRKAIAKGMAATAAARRAGTGLPAILRWLEEEAAAPVSIKDRPCLRCGNTFKSRHKGNRLCDTFNGAVAALPASWTA